MDAFMTISFAVSANLLAAAHARASTPLRGNARWAAQGAHG